MLLERIKTQGLANISYFIGSENEAIVVDPRRDFDVYLELSIKHSMKIKYILETHRNEDFVIGSQELSKKTSAPIFHGDQIDFEYGETIVDGQELAFGSTKVKGLHTPGHTKEHFSYVIYSEKFNDQPMLVCTGDVLFAGDVGRTDFYGPENTAIFSEKLYNSLHEKILPLGDEVIVCPGHGSGSVCGMFIEPRDLTTIGIEKKLNRMLNLSKEKFIDFKVKEKHIVAPYMANMEHYNQTGTAPHLSDLIEPQPLLCNEFKEKMDEGALVVDTRMPADYGMAHIEGSINIMLEGLSLYAGWFLKKDQPILLVLSNPTDIAKAKTALWRIGIDNIVGYLAKGITGWYGDARPIRTNKLLSVHELKEVIDKHECFILDVRKQTNWEKEHIKDSYNIFVGKIPDRVNELPEDKDKRLVVLCGIGTRASIASSILQRLGYNKVSVVLGSFTAWKKAGYLTIKSES